MEVNLSMSAKAIRICEREAVESLKVCPVCDAVNSGANLDCYVCSWNGKFNTEPSRIVGSLPRLLLTSPELALALERPSIFQRFRTWWTSMWMIR